MLPAQKEARKSADTRRLALTSVLAAIAALLSFSSISFPFPLLPFLRFDLAEVPDLLSFFLLGPAGGMTVTLIHWMLLNLHSSFDPVIGPTMKFMAVFATMLGVYVGTYFVDSTQSKRKMYLIIIATSTIIRFLAMIPPTFLLYYLISPNRYLPFAVQSLSAIGIHTSGILASAIIITLFTGLFNIIHAFLTVTLTWLVYSSAERMGVINSAIDWFKLQLQIK